MNRRRACFVLAATLTVLGRAGAGELRRTPVVAAVERVAPAVVNIATEQLSVPRAGSSAAADPLFEEFFRNYGDAQTAEHPSLGSGTIVDHRGFVLTNQHVVDRASRIRVLLADKREFDADVVGADPASDLAVLKIRTSEKLPAVSLGTSADLMIGETLIAIGNPFGLSHSVSVGVLSARARSVRAGERVFGDFLQTDASINPGNSGGPLLNLDGDVVGIATAIYSSGHGIGFAIPIDRAKRVLESILSHGTARPLWIGIEGKPIGQGLAQAVRLAPGQGLVVTHVVEASPAADAKVKTGDIVATVGGVAVGAAAELDAALARLPVDSAVKLELVRDGRRVTMNVRPLRSNSPNLGRIAEAVLGLKVAVRPKGLKGLAVLEAIPLGRAAQHSIAAGDLLYEIDGVKLESLESFRAAFYRALLKQNVLMLVQHGDSAFYVPIALD